SWDCMAVVSSRSSVTSASHLLTLLITDQREQPSWFRRRRNDFRPGRSRRCPAFRHCVRLGQALALEGNPLAIAARGRQAPHQAGGILDIGQRPHPEPPPPALPPAVFPPRPPPEEALPPRFAAGFCAAPQRP